MRPAALAGLMRGAAAGQAPRRVACSAERQSPAGLRGALPRQSPACAAAGGARAPRRALLHAPGPASMQRARHSATGPTRPPRRAAGPPAALAAWLGALDAAWRPAAAALAPAPPAAQQPPSSALPPQPAAQQQQRQRQQGEAQPQGPMLADVDGLTLVHQQLAVRRARYAPPRRLHPQPGQLVGLLFTLLGAPTFTPTVPGLRHPSTEGERGRGAAWQRGQGSGGSGQRADGGRV
jgi:hypothetical protein